MIAPSASTSTRFAWLLATVVAIGALGRLAYQFFDVMSELPMLVPGWAVVGCTTIAVVVIACCIHFKWRRAAPLSLLAVLLLHTASVHFITFNALTGDLKEGIGPVVLRSTVLKNVDRQHYCYDETEKYVNLRIRGEPPIFSTFIGIWPVRLKIWFPFPKRSERP